MRETRVEEVEKEEEETEEEEEEEETEEEEAEWRRRPEQRPRGAALLVLAVPAEVECEDEEAEAGEAGRDGRMRLSLGRVVKLWSRAIGVKPRSMHGLRASKVRCRPREPTRRSSSRGHVKTRPEVQGRRRPGRTLRHHRPSLSVLSKRASRMTQPQQGRAARRGYVYRHRPLRRHQLALHLHLGPIPLPLKPSMGRWVAIVGARSSSRALACRRNPWTPELIDYVHECLRAAAASVVNDVVPFSVSACSYVHRSSLTCCTRVYLQNVYCQSALLRSVVLSILRFRRPDAQQIPNSATPHKSRVLSCLQTPRDTDRDRAGQRNPPLASVIPPLNCQCTPICVNFKDHAEIAATYPKRSMNYTIRSFVHTPPF